MKSTNRFRYCYVEIVKALTVLLFLYTAIMKLKDHTGFVAAIEKNPLLADYASLLSWLVPVCEIVLVVLLAIPRSRRVGLLGSFILMVAFTAYVGYMVATSSDLPCTCGGIVQQMSWQQHFVFNTIFSILTLTSFLLFPKRYAVANRSSRTPVNIVGNISNESKTFV